ncbi:YibE/F family protein [Actinotalea ferrariae CF5-4]|uniref:YibE/F family protein n=1 Tax=Actinotalea ferrariae CF5-4 TaxID=948458 RepID=A0A021VRB1_9CELL|nr:YibE/F family protein [Actinotalea ferrariae]EYR63734.1 YibE/F family protein [Actinotalea ferrariae CF5-4]
MSSSTAPHRDASVPHDDPREAPGRRPAVVLAALLLPAALLTVLGLVLLWPSGERPETGIVVVDAEYPSAEVVGTREESCGGTSEDRLPDGTVPEQVRCVSVVARVLDGEAAGTEVEVWSLPALTSADLPPGTRVVLERYLATPTEPEAWAFHDVARTAPLGVLAAAFAVVVVAVAGLRGLRAIVGLAIAFGVVAVFVLPALLEGRDPLAVGLTGSAAIMFVVLYLAHGFSLRTTTALLGTFAGLGVTAGLGVLAASAARLSGVTTEEEYRLAQLTGQLDGSQLRGLFLCGVVLAGLGVLNDVTITQASAVWELRAADPGAAPRSLFRGGMRIGRDHIASTVYTIAFAYAGAALPVLLLLEVYQLPWALTVGSGEFAQEIARTLVGSIGLVLAIPLTTAIAAVVVTRLPVRQVRREGAAHAHVA